MISNIRDRIADGRADLVFEVAANGQPAASMDRNGVRLIRWCAHYGDVSAMRFLLERDESLRSLGQERGQERGQVHFPSRARRSQPQRA